MKTTNICDRHLQWDTIILESTSSLSQKLLKKGRCQVIIMSKDMIAILKNIFEREENLLNFPLISTPGNVNKIYVLSDPTLFCLID